MTLTKISLHCILKNNKISCISHYRHLGDTKCMNKEYKDVTTIITSLVFPHPTPLGYEVYDEISTEFL